MRGCPPRLGWDEGVEGPGEYLIELDTGEGAGWGGRRRAEAREHIRIAVVDHLAVISAMDRLAENRHDAEAFEVLHRLAVGANLAC